MPPEAASRFLKNFALLGFSSRKSRFRGLAAPQPGDVRGFPRPGQVAFAAASLLFPKSFKTGQQNLFSNLERRVSDMVSNWCSLEHIFYKTSSNLLRGNRRSNMRMSNQRFLLRRLLKNIGTRSNDSKQYKSSKRSYFGSRGNQRRQQRVAERRQRGAAPPFPTTAHEVASVLLVAGRRS